MVQNWAEDSGQGEVLDFISESRLDACYLPPDFRKGEIKVKEGSILSKEVVQKVHASLLITSHWSHGHNQMQGSMGAVVAVGVTGIHKSSYDSVITVRK